MADVFTKQKRSEVMSRIRSSGNKDTELALARLLRAKGITGWRRQLQVRIVERGTRNSLRTPRSELRVFTVTPDFVFLKQRLTVFVDGCFWHGCPRHATWPRNNAGFWRRKLAANQARDRLVTRTLRREGWQVVRIWECALKNRPQVNLRRIEKCLSPGGKSRPVAARAGG